MIIKIENYWQNSHLIFNFDNVLIDEKSSKSILIYDISYKDLLGSNLTHIRFDEINGFIKVGIMYLVLFDPERYDALYNRIRYLVSKKVVLCTLFLTIMQK